ncbi:DUF2742 domain-containing protein [Mycobacterium europaeum]|uniref:DUF2742 domain-containing protein n=1 Tax=Mycobacterium europaeum TaxID=761804 RepID=UPI000AA22EA0
MTAHRIASRTVDWWPVHLFVLPTLNEARSWPLAGSPAWGNLADDDPAKLASVLDGGRHDALRNDTISAALAEASKAIARSTDWSAVSRDINHRRHFYAARPWLRRSTAC